MYPRLDREASVTISLPRDTTYEFDILSEYEPVLSRFVGGYPSPCISVPQSQNKLKSLMFKEVAAIEAYLDLQDRDAKREPWLIPRPQRHCFLQFLTDICSIHPRAIPAVTQFLALLPPGYAYLPSAHRGRPNSTKILMGLHSTAPWYAGYGPRFRCTENISRSWGICGVIVSLAFLPSKCVCMSSIYVLKSSWEIL